MAFIVREMMVSDAASVAGLSQQLGYPMTEASTLQAMKEIVKSKNDSLFVAITARGEVAGCIHVFHTMRLESGSFCEIGGLVVDEALQKKRHW